MRKTMLIAVGFFLLSLGSTAHAYTITLNSVMSGHDEREDAPAPCTVEPNFLAGINSAEMNLMVGGNAYGCDSEWAASCEFLLSGLPLYETVLSATLVVTKTGYADDAQGYFYLGAFGYPATGLPVMVPRADLTPTTALDVLYPPVSNSAMNFDVKTYVETLLDNHADRAGFLLSGIYSEAGYEDWISVGGGNSPNPPRLVIEMTGVVANQTESWSRVKALYR